MTPTSSLQTSVRAIPHFWVGLLLIAVCWPLNWSPSLGPTRTAYLFFPLWLGYILTVDGLVLSRTRRSLWTRSRRDFVLLFVASSPVWWMFEAINGRTQNWQYLGENLFTAVEYYVLCTLCFSTVMPAVFETAELARSFKTVAAVSPGARVRSTPRLQLSLFFAGVSLLALTLLFPRYCYPFVWLSLVLLLEPLNFLFGRRYLLQFLENGDWRPLLSLALGAVICGFFWEMWNYYASPKWVYHTPGAQYLHIFEMPLLGYGGYVPFALELFALKNFLWPNSPTLQI
jgi:hypothetical protein